MLALCEHERRQSSVFQLTSKRRQLDFEILVTLVNVKLEYEAIVNYLSAAVSAG